MIYEVKRSERGDNFKKKISWAMRDLKVLDAKDATNVKILYILFSFSENIVSKL